MSDPHFPEPLTDLAGWKDVAAYLGRSVRTVQRWEKELGLPVRRVRTQAGEVIYASRRDLDAWLASRQGQTATEGEANGGAEGAGFGEPPNEPTEPARPTTPPAAAAGPSGGSLSSRWIWAGAFSLGLAAMVGVLADRSCGVVARKAQPSSWAVEDGALAIRDSTGRLLWTHRFEYPLNSALMSQPGHAYGGVPAPWVVLDDIDGDHATEVLAVGVGTTASGHPAPGRMLHCFEWDGRVRFVHEIRRSVRFGDETFDPPYVDMPPFVVRSGPRAFIWLLSLHSPYFPSVLQKLTPTGEVVGEYWQAGHPVTMSEVERGGRRFLVVGGTRNEDFSAALSVLDANDPTGMAPAHNEKYRCRDCPGRAPAVYLSFPQSDIGRLAGTRAVVMGLRDSPSDLLVQISYLSAQLGSDCDGTAYFHLDDRFRVVGADLSDGYVACHARLRLEGRLDHDLGPGEVAEMFPVRAWYDGVPELVDRPARQPVAATASR